MEEQNETKAQKEHKKIVEKTKEILLKKLNQLFVLFRYSDNVKIPMEWFYTSVQDGMDMSQKTKFKIVNIMEINKEVFESMLDKNNICYIFMKDKKSIYFYKVKTN